MWKCKKCGGTKFESVEGRYILNTNLVFDKDGFIEHDFDSETTTKYTLGCCNCNNIVSGVGIEELAEWIDES